MYTVFVALSATTFAENAFLTVCSVPFTINLASNLPRSKLPVNFTPFSIIGIRIKSFFKRYGLALPSVATGSSTLILTLKFLFGFITPVGSFDPL